jgi:hypothetical protein
MSHLERTIIKLFGMDKDSVEALNKGLGKVIKSVELKENKLCFTFANELKMFIADEGQQCCEQRYIVCDDDLSQFQGSTLMNVEIKEGPTVVYGEREDDRVTVEIAFLEITTSYGSFQCATYNEHNGYYAGFSIKVRVANEHQRSTTSIN